jgi:hypothetical protein
LKIAKGEHTDEDGEDEDLKKFTLDKNSNSPDKKITA